LYLRTARVPSLCLSGSVGVLVVVVVAVLCMYGMMMVMGRERVRRSTKGKKKRK